MQVKVAGQNKPSDEEVFIALEQVGEEVMVRLRKPDGTDIVRGRIGTFVVEGGKLTFRRAPNCNLEYVNREVNGKIQVT
jgi:hypothetical protein